MKGLNAFAAPILLIGGLFYSPLSNSATLKVDCKIEGFFQSCRRVTLKAGNVWESQVADGTQEFDLKDYSGDITGVFKYPTGSLDLGTVKFNPQKDCTLTIIIATSLISIDPKEFDNKCPPQME
ncbi:MAG: hypothetical protein AAES65_11470 [Candidatus Thiodiazotropha sp. (ex. Lucinoma kazani)]